MPTNTSKFNLVKPLKSEKYNVDVFNGNADIIDSQIYSKTEVDTALNGKAPLVHTHPISEVVNLQTTLNGKANTTTTVNNQPLSSNITINASGVPNTPAGNISATTVQNAINELDTEKVDKLMATNLVTNGDFSNGTTGWTFSSGALSIEGEYITLTSTPTDTTPSIRQLCNTISGRRYYFRSSSIIDLNATQRFLLFGTSTNEILGSSVLANVENVFSGVITALTNNTSFGFGFFSSEQVAKRVRMRRPLIIDLTQLFGAGNEPTRAQMDYLLSNFPNSWFNGTVELMNYRQLLDYAIDLDNAKANRTQEAWITPTLVNGATGTIRYRRNQFGRLEFIGTLSNAFGTLSLTLLTGYRPASTRRIIAPREDSTGHRVVLINSAGAVVPDLPSGTFSIDLTGCSIPLD